MAPQLVFCTGSPMLVSAIRSIQVRVEFGFVPLWSHYKGANLFGCFYQVKTKMQAQPGFEKMNMIKAFVDVFKREGVKGLYRGCVPPLWGSGIYRSLQFSGFEATYTFFDNPFGRTTIPLTNGTEIRVIFGGITSGTLRTFVETPLEYAKTKRQTGGSWHLRQSYTGLKITWIRGCTMMPTYFTCLDAFRRNFDDLFRTQFIGPFLASGTSSVIAWFVAWPLELARCQIQAGYLKEKNLSIIGRIKYAYIERGGLRGVYRGFGPGSIRCFLGNGFGMILMQFIQRSLKEWGIR